MKVEQQALLNALMYYDGIVYDKNKTLGENLIDMQINEPEKWDEMISNCPGVIGSEKAKKVVNSILLDPELKDMRILESTRQKPYDDGPIMMFVANPKTRTSSCIFRGTNGREWQDNAEGFTRESSILQKDALRFFEDTVSKHKLVENGYKIDVSGHSKGGNKAAYVTIKNKDDIVRNCYSFDGQGFSNEFMEENKKAIASRKDKITTFAADYDYVNPLGNPIGNKVFFKTNNPTEEEKLLTRGQMINIGTQLPVVSVPFAHSPGAYFHFDENENIKMNKPVPVSDFSKNVQDMSLCMMNNPDKGAKTGHFNSVMGLIQIMHTNDPISEEKMPSYSEIKTGLNESIDFLKEKGYGNVLFDMMRSPGGNALIELSMRKSVQKRNDPIKEVLYDTGYKKLTDGEIAIYQDKKNHRSNFVGVDMGRKQLARVSGYKLHPETCESELENLSEKKELKSLYLSKSEPKTDYTYNIEKENSNKSVTIMKESKDDLKENEAERVKEYGKKMDNLSSKQLTKNQKSIMVAMREAEKIDNNIGYESELFR